MTGSRLIAVTGGSGSGKSWLAAALCADLGDDAAHLSLDHFYRDLGHLPEAERERVNFDDPAAIDWDSLRDVLAKLRAGEAAQVPRYDFATHLRMAETHVLMPARCVIVEGLWLLHTGWLRDFWSMSVFVHCCEKERLRRRIARDVVERGRSEESVRRQFAEHVEPMHERFVEPQSAWATHVVESPVPQEERRALALECAGLPTSGGSPETPGP